MESVVLEQEIAIAMMDTMDPTVPVSLEGNVILKNESNNSISSSDQLSQ